jgi:glycosyltransferase involved in cell wall biosynthesis
MDGPPLNVAVVTKWDPLDSHSWSGTMRSMCNALKRRGVNLTPLGPVRSGARMALHCGDMFTQAVFSKSYDYRHSLLVAREYAFRFERKLAAGNFDVIFAPVASTEISLLKTDVPIVYLTDILFPDYMDYYPQCSRLLGFSAAEVSKIEALAMRKAKAFICPAEWVKKRAISAYGLSEEQVHVLPFGANLERTPSYEEATEKRDLSVCRLLFLGVNWERKGGPIAVEVLRLLVDAGIPAELTVCGCVPPSGVAHPNMRVIPFLSKRDPSQAQRLAHLLETSTFLFLPTVAEAYGIVFCEASAFGLPSIARNTGGVGGVVQDGVNGYKIDRDAGPEAYAQIIMALYKDEDRYHALSVSSRQAYDRRLNWDAWGEGAQRALESVSKRHQLEVSLVE